MKKYLKIILKKLALFLVILILLFAALVLAIRTPQVQKFLTNKAETWFKSNTGALLTVDKIYLNWNNKLVVENLYLGDNSLDTLLFLGNLSTRIGLTPLLDQTVELSSIDLENTKINLLQSGKEEIFNFQFILERLTSDNPKVDTTKSDPWKIEVEEINLRKIDFTLQNEFANTDLKVNLESVETKIDDLDIDSLHFKISEFILDGADIYYKEGKGITSTETDTSSTSPSVRLAVEFITINNFKIDYISPSFIYDGNLNNFITKNLQFDLQKQQIGVESIALNNSDNSVELLPSEVQSPDSVKESGSEFLWNIEISKILITNNGFFLKNQKPESDEFNPEQLDLLNINSEISAIKLSPKGYQADIENLSLTEGKSINIKSFQSEFQLLDSLLTVKNFKLQTEKSVLESDFSYNLKEQGQKAGNFNISGLKGSIATADIAYFYPPFKNYPIKKRINFTGNATGNLNNLKIDYLTASTGSTKIETKGVLSNLISTTDPISFDIPIFQLNSTSGHLYKLIPDSLRPEGILFPNEIQLTTNLKGNLSKANGKLKLLTDLGRLKSDLSYQEDKSKKTIAFSLKPQLDSLQLGKILDIEELGSLTMNAKISGSGKSFAESRILIEADIKNITYNDYNYQDININGVSEGISYDGIISSQSEDLNFEYEGIIALEDSLTKANFTLDINHADFERLNFSPTPLKLKTKIKTDLSYSEINELNGDLSIRKTELERSESIYFVDSLVLISINDNTRNDLTLDSDLFNGYLKGNIPIADIPQTLRNHFKQYFSTDITSSDSYSIGKNFEFVLDIKKPELISKTLIPELERLKISPLKIDFDGSANTFNVNWDIHKLIYNGIEVDSLYIGLEADQSSLSFKTLLTNLEAGDITVSDVTLYGESENDAVNVSLNIPKDNRDEFHLTARLSKEGDKLYAFLYPDTVLFRGNKWSLPENNQIIVENGIWIEHMNFSNNGKMLSINSKVELDDTIQVISLQKFSLENLTSSLGETNGLIGGKANGSLEFNQSKSTFKSQLDIKNLSYTEKPLGDLTLNASNANDIIQLNAILSQP